jgi:heme/copper-type cytochrome/quinol oxidase subunit 1
MPWAGLALGTLGYFVQHQLGADSTFQDCRVGSPWIVVLGTIVGLLIIAAGALGSWRVYASETETPARKLVAIVSLLACALYAIGTILPFIAAMVIPGCWR